MTVADDLAEAVLCIEMLSAKLTPLPKDKRGQARELLESACADIGQVKIMVLQDEVPF